MSNSPNGIPLIETPTERAIREQAEENSRAKKHRELQVLFNAILTFATIVTAAIVLYQNHVLSDSLAEMKTQSGIMNNSWEEMRKQTQPMIDAANATAQQTELFRKELEIASGAVLQIGVPHFESWQEGRLSALFQNIGKQPATHVTVNTVFSINDLPKNTPRRKFTVQQEVPSITPFNEHAVGSESGRYPWIYKVAFIRDELERFNSGKLAMLAETTVTYNNGFSTIRTPAVCYGFLGFHAQIEGDWVHVAPRPFLCSSADAEVAHFPKSVAAELATRSLDRANRNQKK